MPRDWHVRLKDMLDVIAYIEIAEIGFADHDTPTQRLAFERAFEILSEASRHLPADVKSRYAHIRWQDLADLGNIIRHAYDRVSLDRLRETARRDVAPLKGVLVEIEASGM